MSVPGLFRCARLASQLAPVRPRCGLGTRSVLGATPCRHAHTSPSRSPSSAATRGRSSATAPEYELFYWPVTALGEPIRMILTIGGIPFKDNTPKNCAYFSERKEAAGCQLPFLTIDGEVLGQSRAILRYLGKQIAYEGKPLYPADPLEAYRCDELMDLVEDARQPLGRTFSIQDQGEKEAARAVLFAEDGAIAKELRKLDRRLGFFGPDITIADLYVFSLMNSFRQPTFIDGIPAGAIDVYNNIQRHHEFVATLPPIAEYYKAAEGIRVTFKPFK